MVILPALISASLTNSEQFCVYTASQPAMVAGHHLYAITFMIQLRNQLVLSHWSPNSSTGQSVLILTHGPCTFNNLCVSYYLLAAGNSFLPCLSLKGHCNCCSAKLQPRCRKRKSSWAPNIPLKEIAWSFPSGNQNAGFLKHLDK